MVYQSHRSCQLTSDTGIYAYCGLEVKKHLFFDQTDRASKEKIDGFARRIAALYEEQSVSNPLKKADSD